jgi:hypothetical protein
MTPKEKAKELVDKFTVVGLQQRNEGIQCALIAVQEIIEKLVELSDGKFTYINDVQYYQEVKNEIKKL